MMRRAVLISFILLFSSLTSFSAAAKGLLEKPIYLYLSPLTTDYLKRSGTSNNTALAVWRKYLRRVCRCFEEIGRAELLGKLKPGLLILASSEVLDDDERKAIVSFTDAGGSVLATGMTGTRDAKGDLTGHGFVNSLFKIQVKGEFASSKGEDWFMMPFGDGPLTWSIPAQRRIYMGDSAQNMLRIDSDNLAAIVMNWNREKEPTNQAKGVMAFHETQKYRGVYFGFSEAAMGFVKPSELGALLDSTIAWLQREPRLVKAAWPNANIAAHLMEMDTESSYNSAVNFAADVESIGTKTTFYSTTSEAAKFPTMVKELIDRGHEIAYHADVHTGFEKMAPAKQDERIKAMIAQMTTMAGPDTPRLATGFRAPLESYDIHTELLLRKHGMQHHAADPSSTENRLPFFSKVEPELGPEDALVVLPRTQLDDINFTALGYSPAETLATLKHDLDWVIKGGAFGLLSVHSQNYHTDRLLPKVMPDYVKYVATFKDSIWIPRADEIAAWWRRRERVTVKQIKQTEQVENSKNTVMQVNVKAPGEVSGLTVLVMNPKSGVLPAVEGRGVSAPKVRVKAVDAFRSALIFDRLSTGDYEYVIRYP